MKKLRILQHRVTTVLLLFCTSIISAQSSSTESFKVGDDVLVSINTSHTNVVIETWNKDMVEVEAFIDDDKLSAKEKKEIFDNWDFDVLGNSKKVIITSNEGSLWDGFESMGSLKALKRLEGLHELKALEHLKNMPLIMDIQDMDWNIVVPDVPNYRQFPKWPFSDERPTIRSGEGMHFDFKSDHERVFDRDEYDDGKKAYVNKLNKKYESNVSVSETDTWLEQVDEWADEFEDVMQKWGEDFGEKFEHRFGPEFEKKMEKWGEEFGKEMEKWGEEFGEKFGKEMEQWGEEFGKSMEKWAEQFEEDAEKWSEKLEKDGHNYSKKVTTDPHGNKSVIIQSDGGGLFKEAAVKAKKTIIIRMPKGARTDINVRHGEVKMADARNVNATLNYATLTANSIDGGETLINAAYAPVYVNRWANGTLDLKYVDDCKLNLVDRINLQANSSDVNIISINKKAIISGSFGNLFVGKIGDDFEAIDIVLENTDATLSMPKSAFTFYFNGRKSRFTPPSAMEITTNEKGSSRTLLEGYYKSKDSNRSLTIHADYSNINFQ